MKVLVTGASGMLGRSVAKALTERGDDVTVLQRRASGLVVREIRGDICDGPTVQQACNGQDAVVHLAAKVSVTGEWDEFHRVNVVATRLLLDTSRAAGVSRFVYVSSPSVAHTGRPLVAAGAHPACPPRSGSYYASSKALAELLALDNSQPTFSVVAIRPHLVWGPGDTQLVARVVERARQGRLVLIGGGRALIDSTYVDNAVSALVAALDRAPRISGQAFVVSNGEPRTVAELLTRICRAYGVPEPTRSVPVRTAKTLGWIVERLWQQREWAGEPPMTPFLAQQLGTAHWFDQRRTREALDWSPRVSLAQGFAQLSSG